MTPCLDRMSKLQNEKSPYSTGRSYQNRLPGTVKGDAPSPVGMPSPTIPHGIEADNERSAVGPSRTATFWVTPMSLLRRADATGIHHGLFTLRALERHMRMSGEDYGAPLRRVRKPEVRIRGPVLV